MATGSDKKVHGITAFNSGEYSSDLAGRTDLESFASSSRYSCNFLTQVSGGLKKFYGTYHITEKSKPDYILKMIPFVNKYEPMVFVIFGPESEGATGLKVGLLHGDNYQDLDIEVPATVVPSELRWQQVNDRLILCHKSVQPFEIDFYGIDDDGNYVFTTTNIPFTEVPYFPVGSTNDYRGTFVASALTGEITLTVTDDNIATYFPPVLVSQSTFTRTAKLKHCSVGIDVKVNNSVLTLKRIRGGVETTLATGVVNTYKTKATGAYNDLLITVTDSVTRESVLRVVQTVCPDAYIDDYRIVMPGLTGHTTGDIYYTELVTGRIKIECGTQETIVSPQTYTSEQFTTEAITTDAINAEALVGRKIKLFFNDDTQIDPWWQGKTVTTGDYVYSNGHWYKAQNSGTCGNVQPSHTSGIRTDGAVAWLYVHSGSNTGTVLSVDEAQNQITILVPKGEIPKNTANIYRVYSWSIWGKDGIHPSDVYWVGGRLGFVCNTTNFGAWNAMSVTDDYFNFSTEEYGEQLDTSAIVSMVGNNEASEINWVLARTKLYMGGYSGEYFVNPGGSQRRSSVYTPTSTNIENISNMGGRPVVPLKYKELNMFVGGSGKELYTISYDYTTDDYSPRMLGYLTQHIMERGIRRMEAVNNLDRNIYMLHDTNELSLFNYAAEQKVLGFTELDFGNEVVDFCSTHANEEVAAYVAVKRNDKSATISQTRGGDTLGTLTVDIEKFSKMVGADGDYGFEYGVSEWYHDSNEVDLADYGITFTGTPHATDEITVSYIAPKVTFERLAIEHPTYVFDEIQQGDGETEAAFVPVPHFANRTVWIKYGDDLSQFVKVTLDENGDISHDIYTGVYLPTAKKFAVGLPMVSELHTQPAFGQKIEGHQQQSLSVFVRLNKSGAFEYGCSVDFDKYFKYDMWNTQQEYSVAHRLYTGDIKLDIPLGYAEAQNQGEGKYPNDTAVGLNIRSDSPEPLNILSVQEIYV